MKKRDRAAKIKRIQEAIKTLDEVMGHFWDSFSLRQRRALADTKIALKFAYYSHLKQQGDKK